MNPKVYDSQIPESHLLNRFDTQGDIPEYEPYSLFTDGYSPMINWQKNPSDSKESFAIKPPFKIENKQEFIDMSKTNKTILLEITEKGANAGSS